MTATRPSIVILGMMTKMPVAGVVWQTLQYMLGFEDLGFDTYYVETHGRTPSRFVRDQADDGTQAALVFLAAIMHRFGFDDRWCFRALHGDGLCYGMSLGRLHATYAGASAVINLCGGTMPRPEHIATDRLVYLETDPVQLEAEIARGDQAAIEFLQAHNAYFTFAENFAGADCTLPMPAGFNFQPTRQPIVMSLWDLPGITTRDVFTTIGNWRQERAITLDGRRYSWSKHDQFVSVLDLPNLTGREFELALGSYSEEDRRTLQAKGWRVRDAGPLSSDLDAYRTYIATSLAEFTVAKEQNVVLQTGWFSDRAATYLAAGRPVITQHTAACRILPCGAGLHCFENLDEAVASVELVAGNPTKEAARAREIAVEFFSHEVVLGNLLHQLGLDGRRLAKPRRVVDWLPAHLSLEPVRRDPIRLDEDTERAVMERPLTEVRPVIRGGWTEAPEASIVIPMNDRLVLTRLCIESILASTSAPSYEIVAVDDGSSDATPEYLEALSARHSGIRVNRSHARSGFATAVNRGLQRSRGSVLVVLNNDTVVAPGWLDGLAHHLREPSVGLVGAVSSGVEGPSKVRRNYSTLGGFVVEAGGRAAHPSARQVDRLTFFCVAMRRDVYAAVGGLDEGFGAGLFEDDDYCRRVSDAGLSLLCADDVLVHHFGRGTLGSMVPTGEYMALFERNRARFELKWGQAWRKPQPAEQDAYIRLREQLQQLVMAAVPEGERVAVASKGDPVLLDVPGRRAEHFPGDGGQRAGGYPGDSAAAVLEVTRLQGRGVRFLVFPATSSWWLDYYPGLAAHLAKGARRAAAVPDVGVVYDLKRPK